MKVLALTFSSLALFVTFSTAEAKQPPVMRNLVKSVQGVKLPKAKKIAPQCADFSGTWKGTCTEADGTVSEADTLVIKQTKCHDVEIDGYTFPINGEIAVHINPDVDSEDAFPFAGSIRTEWNDSQTRLRTLAVISFGHAYAAGVSLSSMWLAGDTLRVKDEKQTPLLQIDGSQYEFVTEDCSYTKAQ